MERRRRPPRAVAVAPDRRNRSLPNARRPRSGGRFCFSETRCPEVRGERRHARVPRSETRQEFRSPFRAGIARPNPGVLGERSYDGNGRTPDRAMPAPLKADWECQYGPKPRATWAACSDVAGCFSTRRPPPSATTNPSPPNPHRPKPRATMEDFLVRRPSTQRQPIVDTLLGSTVPRAQPSAKSA